MGRSWHDRRWRLALILTVALVGAFTAAAAIGGAQASGTAGQAQTQGGTQSGSGEGQAGKQQRGESKQRSQNQVKAGDGSGDSAVWSNFFPWADDNGLSSNWISGLGLALLGVFGALVTIYLFLGEFLPSMGGKADYEAIGLEIEDLSKRRDKQLAPREGFARDGQSLSPEQRDEAAKLTEDFNRIIERKEKAAQKVKRELVAIGFPLYVLLGGAFSVLLASNAPQALLIGFGWTAVVDRFGLKRELGEKSRKRDNASGKLVDAANETAATKTKLAEVESQLSEAQQTIGTATAAVAAAAKQKGSGSV